MVRYQEAFEPPREALEADADTLALFHFEGSREGVCGARDEVIVPE